MVGVSVGILGRRQDTVDSSGINGAIIEGCVKVSAVGVTHLRPENGNSTHRATGTRLGPDIVQKAQLLSPCLPRVGGYHSPKYSKELGKRAA